MADAPEYRVKIVGDPPLTGLGGWFEWLAKKRDALLVTGGLLYALGYAVWSYFAWRNGLGLLPAIDSQYFIAGIVPTIIFLLVALGIRYCWLHAGTAQLPFWLNSGADLQGWRRWLRTIVYVALSMLIPLGVVVGETDYFRDNYPRLSFWMLNVFNILMIAFFLGSIFFADPDARQGHETWGQWLKRVFGRPLLILILFVLGVAAIFYYINLLYSRLPQSLGGVKPRAARLDLDREALSGDMLKALVSEAQLAPLQPQTVPPAQDGALPQPAATPLPAPKVVSSTPVEVLFSGSDVIVIRTGGRVYEIRREVVKAIAWQE